MKMSNSELNYFSGSINWEDIHIQGIDQVKKKLMLGVNFCGEEKESL